MKKILFSVKSLILFSFLFSCASQEANLMTIPSQTQAQSVTKNSFEDGSVLIEHDKKAQKILFSVTDFGMKATYELFYKVVKNKKVATKFRSYPNGVDILKQKFLVITAVSSLSNTLDTVKAEDKPLMKEIVQMLEAFAG